MISWLKMQRQKNCLRFFTYSIIAVLLGVVVLFAGYIIGVLSQNDWELNETYFFNRRPAVVITGSMSPIIKVNSLVVLEPVSFEDIEIGDIIRYTNYNGIDVIHRVIGKNISYVSTKGDANDSVDTFPVVAEQINGRVHSIYNEFANVVTLLFGTFQYGTSIQKIGVRMFLGCVVLALCIGCLIYVGCFLFEFFTIPYFFSRHKNLKNSSMYWVNERESMEDITAVIDCCLVEISKTKGVKKLLLMFHLRRFYNSLCDEEAKVLKVKKRYSTLFRISTLKK